MNKDPDALQLQERSIPPDEYRQRNVPASEYVSGFLLRPYSHRICDPWSLDVHWRVPCIDPRPVSGTVELFTFKGWHAYHNAV